jgi:hypothetical protein
MSVTRGGRATAGKTSLAAVVVILATAGVHPALAEGLDTELMRQAPAVLKYLRDHGHHNVGVLKFRVKKGDDPASDRVGPLNINLAARLEIALILADDIKQPLGIIHDASSVAATLPGVNHLNKAGRQALFRGRYPLAWGDERVVPDAFLSGVAVLGPDLKSMTVTILAFGKDGVKLDSVTQFAATTDPPALAEAGESFLIRGAFDGGRVETARERVVKTASRVKAGLESNPLRDDIAPVALEVRYDGRPVPLEIRGGKALVREPGRGQQVTFVLRKLDRTPERYGVVLSVNGLNTLYKERLDPFRSWKWVLGPDSPTITVRGFQTEAKTAEAFRVLSAEESRKDAMNYGADAGTIGLVVFRERRGQPEPLLLTDEAEDMAAVSRGAFPNSPPLTLAALKFQLREGATDSKPRGLIVGGPALDAPLRNAEFRPDPTPVMAATITYYRP